MTEPEIVVRALGAFELDVLAELHAACFDEAWDAESLRALLAMPGAFALVASEGEWASAGPRVIGLVIARATAGEAEILALGVRPSARRRGLGRRLLAAGLAQAETRGTGRIFLEVAADNWAARALYRAAGFAEIGRRDNYYRRLGAGVAALVLARDIALGGDPALRPNSKIEKKP